MRIREMSNLLKAYRQLCEENYRLRELLKGVIGDGYEGDWENLMEKIKKEVGNDN